MSESNKRALLKNHAQPAAHGEQILLAHLGDFIAQHGNVTRVGREKPQGQLQDRALAGPGHAKQSFGLAQRKLEGDAAQDRVLFKREMNIFEDNRRPGRLPGTAAVWSVGRVGDDMRLLVRQQGDQQLGHKEIGDQDRDGRGHHRLRRRPAHALRAAARSDAVIAADRRDDEAE